MLVRLMRRRRFLSKEAIPFAVIVFPVPEGP